MQPPDAADGAAEAAAGPITWELSWLQANWAAVVANLAARRKMQVAGAVAPAEVLGFDGQELKLGYDANHEALRRRCTEGLNAAIRAALSELAGKEIRCEYVSGGAGAGAPPRLFGNLSTAEKEEIAGDPAVKSVMGLFGGEVVDVRRDAPPAVNNEVENEQETDILR